MLDHVALRSVAEQVMSGAEVLVEGQARRVERTGSRRFRTVRFALGGKEYQAIEQNPEKSSRWAELARSGQRIMQFSYSHRYFANVCEGVVNRYPAWKGLGLPE